MKISVRDRGYEMNSMDKHEVHLIVGVQASGRNDILQYLIEKLTCSIIFRIFPR